MRAPGSNRVWMRGLTYAQTVPRREGNALRLAADRLDEYEERVAIMMEGGKITEDRYQQMRMEDKA